MQSERMLLCALALALFAGCAAGGEDGIERSDAPLLRGRYTFERPEVGSIRVGGGACTATLFGSARTVITAAHCVDYGTTRGAGSYGDFTLEPRPGERYRYAIRQYVSLGRESSPSEDDVALLQIDRAVPDTVASPAPPSLAYPARGSSVTIYGFGCQSRSSGSGDFSKQAFSHRYGDATYNLCPGDSGGPTMTERGEVFRINSAYIVGEGRDLFGDVVDHLGTLRSQVDRWREGSPLVWEAGAPPPPPPPPSDPPPPPPEPEDPPPSDPPPPPPPSDPPPSDPPPSDPPPPPPPGTAPDPVDSIDAHCRTNTDCESCAMDSYCGWCGASGYCESLRVDGAGRLAGRQCGGSVTIADWLCESTGGDGGSSDPPPPPPPPPPPSPSPPAADCGPWVGIEEYTCRRTRTQFVRCGEAGPEFLTCPGGYGCVPGSTELLCYWGI